MNLREKVGGPISAAAQQAMIGAAQQRLQSMMPELHSELAGLRRELQNARQADTDVEALYFSAHQIRGLAAIVGRPNIGRLADILACYITDHLDNARSLAEDILLSLAAAVDRSFDLEEADPLLNATLNAAAQVVGAGARSEVHDEPPAAGVLSSSRD